MVPPAAATPAPGDSVPSSALHGYQACTWCQTHMQADIYTENKDRKKSTFKEEVLVESGEEKKRKRKRKEGDPKFNPEVANTRCQGRSKWQMTIRRTQCHRALGQPEAMARGRFSFQLSNFNTETAGRELCHL